MERGMIQWFGHGSFLFPYPVTRRQTGETDVKSVIHSADHISHITGTGIDFTVLFKKKYENQRRGNTTDKTKKKHLTHK